MMMLKPRGRFSGNSMDDRMSPRRSAVLVVGVAICAWAVLFIFLRYVTSLDLAP